ncbi:MAG: TetR/AcrR family transcriptional regulator [Burkholderiaceae bacterium]|nr:TetR/AcrR family transcriptional regulator [Burkholderiaceae bacterium]
MKILRTAAELFASQGYESTSLDSIGERMGMHKATLYHYFRNKESILYQCLLASFVDLDDVIARMKDPKVPLVERLRLFVRSLAAAQNNVFGRCLVIVGDGPLDLAPGSEIREFKRVLDKALRDLVAEGEASGLFRVYPHGMVGAMLFGALNWVPRWYRSEGPLTVEQVANSFVDILIEGVLMDVPPRAERVGSRRGGTRRASGR